MFERITIHGWRHFRDIDIKCHDRLTILTGANGAGKTTILNMLNRHFGWNLAFVSTPRRRKKLLEYFSDFWSGDLPHSEINPSRDQASIGEIYYQDGKIAKIQIPHNVSHEYRVNIEGQQPVQGIFISSHRPVFFYQRVTAIPTEPSAREQLLNQYQNEVRGRFSSGGEIQSPSYRLKKAIISLAVFGYGNEVVSPNIDYRKTFEGYQKILRIVLPHKIGFERLTIEMPEVVLKTRSGNFSLDAVSGGISAILDLTWQIYMYSLEHEQFTVVIDEPENHLHPELQQTLLSNILKAFPESQFIIATHNPFMVSSVSDSNVYVLRFNEEGRVFSESLDLVNKAGTANEILRDVLGLDFTLPVWASHRLDEIVNQYSSKILTEQSVSELRGELTELGLHHVLPETLSRIIDEAKDD